MTLKACCMRRQSCARRAPGIFGRLIVAATNRSPISPPSCFRPDAERGQEIADLLADGGRYLDLDMKAPIAGAGDGRVAALVAGHAVGRHCCCRSLPCRRRPVLPRLAGTTGARVAIARAAIVW